MEKYRYLAFFEYIGTNYSGFQIQPGTLTIQGEVERGLQQRFNRPIRIYYRSRTDTGVNAREHPFIFDMFKFVPPNLLRYQVNSLLPDDIRIKKMILVDKDWSLSYNLQAKLYVYRLFPEAKVSPFMQDFVWGCRLKKEIGYQKKIAKIVKLFERKGNFVFFTTREDAETKETVIEIEKASFMETSSGVWEFSFQGRRFLHKMIRMMMGAIIACYKGKLKLEDIENLLNGFSVNGFSPVAVPGKGLTLEKVFLKEEA
jgi:tRNA pseudouridine38-40 synthase